MSKYYLIFPFYFKGYVFRFVFDTELMTALTEIVQNIIDLTFDEIVALEKAFTTIEISRGELWIEKGKLCNQVGFVLSGKLRNYYIDDAGNEVTCYFVTPDHFISSFTSFLTNTPTHENIAALEDSTLRVIQKDELERLSEAMPKLQIFRRIIAENLFITMEKRISMLQSQSAFERYEKMLSENPEILLTVPLQYTASFLGITPQHLSRLRKELVS